MAASTEKKKKGGLRGAPRKAKDPSHDVKSSGGSSKKERKMRERSLTEKTISKPALQKLFCPKVKNEPKNGEKATFTYLDKEHQGMRLSKESLPPTRELTSDMMRENARGLVQEVAKHGRHIIKIEDARAVVRKLFPRSTVFGPAPVM